MLIIFISVVVVVILLHIKRQLTMKNIKNHQKLFIRYAPHHNIINKNI